jgi:hypothetical protein
MLHCVVWYILTIISEELTVSIIRVFITLTKEAVSSSEISVNIYQITHSNIPEESHIHTCHHENLKSNLISTHSQLFGVTSPKMGTTHERFYYYLMQCNVFLLHAFGVTEMLF